MSGWGKAWKLRLAGALMGALLLASCGGGGEQVQKFVPGRVLSFGDENSLMEPGGVKYTINYKADAATAIDCTQLQIWVQILANGFAVPFPQCPVSGISTSPSRMLAQNGARVSDMGAQIDNLLTSDSFKSDDLVTVMVGTHDVLDLYEAVVGSTMSIEQAALEAEARGTQIAGHVNRMAQAGAKVLFSTIPDLSLTPFGRDTTGDPDRTTRLHRLSERLNSKARVGLINDGRMIGLMVTDQSFDTIVDAGGLNTTDPACTDADPVNVLGCNSLTLRTKDGVAATATTWL